MLRWLGRVPARHCLPPGIEDARRTLPPTPSRAPVMRASGTARKAANGVAILSRVGEPVENRRGLPAIRRQPQPLHRGGGLRPADRQPLSAQRQPVAGAQVRLQAQVDGPPPWPRAGAARQQGPGASDRRFQCHSDRPGRLQAGAVGEGRAVLARGASEVRATRRAGLDRRLRALHPASLIYPFWALLAELFERARHRTTCAAQPRLAPSSRRPE